MGTAQKKPLYKYEEYLSLEEASDIRSEYYDGEIFDMAGGTEEHSRIISNVIREVGNEIFEKDCSVFEGNLKVRIEAANSTVYPDAMVVCSPIEYDHDRKDIICNPGIVIEVLSEGTAGYDRGGKFRKYQQLPSLQEYVLIEQKEAQVDVFRRNAQGLWILHSFQGLDAVLVLESLNIQVEMARLYHRVQFED